jgi:hypothetical protein
MAVKNTEVLLGIQAFFVYNGRCYLNVETILIASSFPLNLIT